MSGNSIVVSLLSSANSGEIILPPVTDDFYPDLNKNVTTCFVDDELSGGNDIVTGTGKSLNDGVVGEECHMVPEIGMKFDNVDELFDFYKKYAARVGFPVRRRNSRKGVDGKLQNVAFTCGREGRRTYDTTRLLKPQPTMQSGCKARVNATSDALGVWRITKVIVEHNHQTSPSKSRLFKCNRQIDEHVKRQLEVNDIAGIPLHKSFNSVVVEAGGFENISFTEKDCRNYIDQVRRLRLGEGDAAAIQAYFSKMQAQCHGFFFSLDLDDMGQLRNVFWADSRSREAYKEFGDVVTFDTTYLTNKYDMPFAPFVGVNHHGQSTLLGCGLVSNENTDTFVWLFRTWLQCMEGQAPQGIITDQDRAMQNAIEIVFPNTTHRWCLWHILKKLPEKFGGHNDKGSVMSAIHNAVYETQTPEEFEHDWAQLIKSFTLQENDWLSGLYAERRRWVPCYLKTKFWAGMSTTQRSESMNAFFDGYVHSKTSLKQFVEQYERALRSKVEKEFQADCKSFCHMIPCATTYEMEKQFQTIYTIAKFKEFQAEITGKVYCDVVSRVDVGLATSYLVSEDNSFNGKIKKKMFSVLFERDASQLTCSCHLFEFRGIVCKHAIAVLFRNGVASIPDGYILRRWRRDVSRLYNRVNINYNGWVGRPGQQGYDKMMRAFAKVADLVAEDEDRISEIMEWIEVQASRSSITCRDSSMSCIEGGGAGSCAKIDIQDPNCSKRKGAPRKLRKKGSLESSSKKSKARANPKKDTMPTQNSVEVAPVFPIIPQLSYSQQLMSAYFGGSLHPSAFHINNTYAPVYAPQQAPEDDDKN